jgi:hypothetical protein
MRSDLLSDLTAIGYDIALEGDNIKLCYRKPGSPPDVVKPLIKELRSCKADVVDILKAGNTISSTEKSEPQSNVNPSWPPDVQSLVDWFLTLEPREITPFHLEPHRPISDPVKFCAALRLDISRGPAGPLARYGTLQDDLRNLREYFERSGNGFT